MNAIHQIYCTHCTYGSSALERREGELADEMLGYSARASSLGPVELSRQYDQIQPFLYYYLPTDARAEEKLLLNAKLAPRRLVYCPSLNGLQMLGQISYRQTDTGGRPGSYFGHLLVSARSEGAWSAVDCLKLWGAPWKDQDSSDIEFKLPALDQLDDLLGGLVPAVNDDVLLSFLTTPANDVFLDPANVIPQRWRKIPVTDRQTLFIDVLRGYLGLGSSSRDNVLLVIEDSMAALLFYGVARLLPPGKLREELSFSTFEHNPERLLATLVATQFRDDRNDLPPEVYRTQGFVCNTFKPWPSEVSPPARTSPYAKLMVETLLSGGWPAVKLILESLERAGANRTEHLNSLAQVHGLVHQLLSSTPCSDAEWRQFPMGMTYLQRYVSQRLADPDDTSLLNGVLGSPNHLLLLELLAADSGEKELPRPVRFLLDNVQEPHFPQLFALDRVSHHAKISALVSFVKREGRLPASCPELWNMVPGSTHHNNIDRSLLIDLLVELDDLRADALSQKVDSTQRPALLLALVQACATNQRRKTQIEHLLYKLDDEEICNFLVQHGTGLRNAIGPKNDVLSIGLKNVVLSKRLESLLAKLPDSPQKFEERLSLLRDWVEWFPEPYDAQDLLGKWQKLLEALQELYNNPPRLRPKWLPGSTTANAKKRDELSYKLAMEIKKAMPSQTYGDDCRGAKKLRCLRDLTKTIVGSDGILEGPDWAKMSGYFDNNPLSQPVPKTNKLQSNWYSSPTRSRPWTEREPWAFLFANRGLVIAFAVLLVLVGAIAYWQWPHETGLRDPVDVVDASGDHHGADPTSATAPQNKNPQQAAAEKAAIEAKQAEQQAAAEKAAIEAKQAEQKAAAEKAAIEAKQAEQKAAAEKAAIEAKQAEQKAAAEKAAIEAKQAEQQAAAEKAAIEAKQAEQKAAAEKAAAKAKDPVFFAPLPEVPQYKRDAPEKPIAKLGHVFHRPMLFICGATLPFELAKKAASDETEDITYAIRPKADDEKELAEFRLEDDQLLFKWAVRSDDGKKTALTQKKNQDKMSKDRVVLYILDSADGKKGAYVALYSQEKREPLKLDGGSAILRLRADVGTELLLGSGTLNMSGMNGSSIAFRAREQELSSVPFSLDGFRAVINVKCATYRNEGGSPNKNDKPNDTEWHVRVVFDNSEGARQPDDKQKKECLDKLLGISFTLDRVIRIKNNAEIIRVSDVLVGDIQQSDHLNTLTK